MSDQQKPFEVHTSRSIDAEEAMRYYEAGRQDYFRALTAVASLPGVNEMSPDARQAAMRETLVNLYAARVERGELPAPAGLQGGKPS